MNTSNLPLTIFFGNERSSHAIDITKIKTCTEWSELSPAISESPEIIVFHINTITRQNGTVAEFMMMLETMIKYSNIQHKPHIAVGIDSDTAFSTVKELQKHKILAVVPADAEQDFMDSWVFDIVLNDNFN